MDAPRAIGITMDGNRRYAQQHALSVAEGHRLGMKKIRDCVRWASAAGITEITLYAFSTENWNRAEEEVANLMALFTNALSGPDFEELAAEGYRIRIIGERERLPRGLRKLVAEAEERTKDASAGTLAIAISYGGRAEIVEAANALIASGATAVTEDSLRDHLWTAGMQDPDLLIRTGGDRRLSNFLPWQSIYSELFFTATQWPAFGQQEFASILEAYGKRERRTGR